MAKDYHPKNKPPFFQKEKQKEEETASPKHFLFIQGSPITQVALNRWYKNERSPSEHTLRYYNPKKEYILGNILTWILHSKIKHVKVIKR